MGTKKKKKPIPKEDNKPSWLWGLGKFLLALVPVASLYFYYTINGAEDLRTKVYQPLSAEVDTLSKFVETSGKEYHKTSEYQAMKQDGRIARIPEPLKSKIDNFYSEVNDQFGSAASLPDLIRREVSERLLQIRNKEKDSVWGIATAVKLQKAEEGKKGVSPEFHFDPITHSGRSVMLDVRDPKNPKIAFPGGPTWEINDWIGFPETATKMDTMWTDEQFLYFDGQLDDWFYRVTREDLRGAKTTLIDFLKPIHETLHKSEKFRSLVERKPARMTAARELKQAVDARVDQPKWIRDIVR